MADVVTDEEEQVDKMTCDVVDWEVAKALYPDTCTWKVVEMVACHTFHIQDAYVVAVVDAEQENYKVEDVAVDDVVDST